MESDRVAYYGKTPWHGIGSAMQAGQSVDDWVKAAGLDYQILDSPVEYYYQGETRVWEERRVLHCSDNGQPLDVPTDKYNIVQPREALEVFRAAAESGGIEIETAGTLKDRKLYWALGRVDSDQTIAGDKHTPYVLFCSSADRSSATIAKPTVVRVVCWNTLSAAVGFGKKGRDEAVKRDGGIKLSHRSKYNRDEIRKALGLADFAADWAAFRETMESLAAKPVNNEQARELFSELLRPKAERERTKRADIGAQDFDSLISGQPLRGQTYKAETDRKIRGLETLFDCYQRAPGAAPGTAYGVVQGVTRYIDHERGKSADKRLASAWLGQGAKLKARAVELAQSL
jgi:phage/plasmid-like protein (TIGR03299 family)